MVVNDKTIRYGTKTATGLTIRERHWEELDNVMDWLMEPGNKPIVRGDAYLKEIDGHVGVDFEKWSEDWRRYGEMQGRAHGIAYSLAMWEQPLHTSIDSVRAAAVERWKARQG